MRPRALLVWTILTVVLFSGCAQKAQHDGSMNPPPEIAKNVVAANATITPTPTGAHVTWMGPLVNKSGFRFSIPPGVSRVDAEVRYADNRSAAIALYNAATGRIRCQADNNLYWGEPTRYVSRCSGIAVLDPLPVTWRSSITTLPKDARLDVDLVATPLDGQAAQIKLDRLSMPHLKMLATESTTVAASTDGVKLWVDVTRPDTVEKVPTILVSSPYNQATRAAGLRPQNSTINDWVPRGYAVVNADVRGFARSEGCVEVWSAKEQQDQVDLVEWVAAQPWSDGKVGFYGQSYVGTTPVEAASLAAPHLTTIITVAPVINAYEDWHFGGVPNGEGWWSPIEYQYQDTQADEAAAQRKAETDPSGVSPSELQALAAQGSHGFCDAGMLARANDPRGLYDAFYQERDFKRRAQDVKASVFYSQGFIDVNVKSQMIPRWFDALNVPKKALFGDWVHQHPARADQELLFHAWLDQYLMGRDTGILDTPVVEVRNNIDTIRTDVKWPPDSTAKAMGLDLAGGKITMAEKGTGTAQFLSQPDPQSSPSPTAAAVPNKLTFTGEPLAERVYVAGSIEVAVRLSLEGATNSYLYAQLFDANATERHTITFGMLNLGLRNGYESYEPVTPGSVVDARIPFVPTEYVLRPGRHLELLLRSVDEDDWARDVDPHEVLPPKPGASPQDYPAWPSPLSPTPTQPGIVTLAGEGTALVLPTLMDPQDGPAPGSAGPRPMALSA